MSCSSKHHLILSVATAGAVAAALVLVLRRRWRREGSTSETPVDALGIADLAQALQTLLCGEGTSQQTLWIGWALRELGPPRADVTGDFDRELARIQSNVHPPQLSGEYVYAFVPGLLSSYSPGYFTQSVEKLKGLGLDARYIGVDSTVDAASVKNAARIRLAFRNLHQSTGKQIVVIAHSKGAIDAAWALAEYPELRPWCRAFVSIQAPYGGAAIADDICNDSKPVREMLETILARFDLGLASLQDMSYSARRQVLENDARDLHTVAPGLRILSIASSGCPSLVSPLSLLRLYLRERHGAGSDGLVCIADAILPGSLAVILGDDVDHGTPVLPSLPGTALCGHDIVEAAIATALCEDDELHLDPWDESKKL